VASSDSPAAIGAVSLSKIPSSGRLRPLGATEEWPLPESSEQLNSQRPCSQAYRRGTSRVLGMPVEDTVSGNLPRVLVVSQSETFLRGLRQFLQVEAWSVKDVMELLQALSLVAETRSVIVVDCRKPSIRPIALAALADELPQGVQVVLWGARPTLRYQLAAVSAAARDWLNCSSEDGFQSVASRCEALVC